MQLSVVIPVYNGERYIAACLQSLLAQWSEGVEVIVVNDGSTDHTGVIIDTDFADALSHGILRHVRTPNGGVSAARNLGLDLALGTHVAFVDADDMVAPKYLSTVLTALQQGADIVEFGYRTMDAAGVVLHPGRHMHTRFGLHPMDSVKDAVFSSCVWYPFLRVVRRSLFNGTRFPVGVRFCEDVMTLSAIYKKASSLLALPEVLYDYRINPVGATLNIRDDYAPNLIEFYRSILADQSYSNLALKVCIAYAARQCISKTSDWTGKLPEDLERDILLIPIRSPLLILSITPRFLLFAVLGPKLYIPRKYLRKFLKWRIA